VGGARSSWALLAGEKTVSLSCEPAGGSHALASEACAQLAKAYGDIAAIPAADGMCTLEYAPVTVRAMGFWLGQSKMYEKTFSNRCTAIRDTGGHLFNF
jgi:hypothetical protein